MSIINIVYHDENIYSVAAKEEVAAQKPPRYHSKFENMVRQERKAVLDDHRTMGFAEVPLQCPRHFLRKDCGVRCTVPTSPKQCLAACRKPPVPKKKDLCGCKSPCKETPCRNIRLENIKRVVSAAPRKPIPKYCDTRNGDFHCLVPSGLTPIYLCKKDFGQCPKYLIKRRREQIQMEQCARAVEEEKQPKCQPISTEERAKLLGVSFDFWEEFELKLTKIIL